MYPKFRIIITDETQCYIGNPVYVQVEEKLADILGVRPTCVHVEAEFAGEGWAFSMSRSEACKWTIFEGSAPHNAVQLLMAYAQGHAAEYLALLEERERSDS